MANKIWLDSNGRVLVDSSGNPYYTEKCCCKDCPVKRQCWVRFTTTAVDNNGSPVYGPNGSCDYEHEHWSEPEPAGTECLEEGAEHEGSSAWSPVEGQEGTMELWVKGGLLCDGSCEEDCANKAASVAKPDVPDHAGNCMRVPSKLTAAVPHVDYVVPLYFFSGDVEEGIGTDTHIVHRTELIPCWEDRKPGWWQGASGRSVSVTQRIGKKYIANFTDIDYHNTPDDNDRFVTEDKIVVTAPLDVALSGDYMEIADGAPALAVGTERYSAWYDNGNLYKPSVSGLETASVLVSSSATPDTLEFDTFLDFGGFVWEMAEDQWGNYSAEVSCAGPADIKSHVGLRVLHEAHGAYAPKTDTALIKQIAKSTLGSTLQIRGESLSPLIAVRAHAYTNFGLASVNEAWWVYATGASDAPGLDLTFTIEADAIVCWWYHQLFMLAKWGGCGDDCQGAYCSGTSVNYTIQKLYSRYNCGALRNDAFWDETGKRTAWLHPVDDLQLSGSDAPRCDGTDSYAALRPVDVAYDTYAYMYIRLNIDNYPSWYYKDKCDGVCDPTSKFVPMALWSDADYLCVNYDCDKENTLCECWTPEIEYRACKPEHEWTDEDNPAFRTLWKAIDRVPWIGAANQAPKKDGSSAQCHGNAVYRDKSGVYSCDPIPGFTLNRSALQSVSGCPHYRVHVYGYIKTCEDTECKITVYGEEKWYKSLEGATDYQLTDFTSAVYGQTPGSGPARLNWNGHIPNFPACLDGTQDTFFMPFENGECGGGGYPQYIDDCHRITKKYSEAGWLVIQWSDRYCDKGLYGEELKSTPDYDSAMVVEEVNHIKCAGAKGGYTGCFDDGLQQENPTVPAGTTLVYSATGVCEYNTDFFSSGFTSTIGGNITHRPYFSLVDKAAVTSVVSGSTVLTTFVDESAVSLPSTVVIPVTVTVTGNRKRTWNQSNTSGEDVPEMDYYVHWVDSLCEASGYVPDYSYTETTTANMTVTLSHGTNALDCMYEIGVGEGGGLATTDPKGACAERSSIEHPTPGARSDCLSQYVWHRHYNGSDEYGSSTSYDYAPYVVGSSGSLYPTGAAGSYPDSSHTPDITIPDEVRHHCCQELPLDGMSPGTLAPLRTSEDNSDSSAVRTDRAGWSAGGYVHSSELIPDVNISMEYEVSWDVRFMREIHQKLVIETP